MSSLTHSHDSKPLWLIKPRLNAAEYRDQLIGSVVKYTDMPIERRIPYRTPKLPREMVADLDPRPVQVHDVSFWTRRIKDAGVSATFNDILEFFVERAKEDGTERTATVARMWHMDSPGEKFKELLKNREFYNELFELLRDNHGQGYFITEVVTLVNLEMRDVTKHKHGAGAGASVPVEISGLVKAGAKAKVHISREVGAAATYDEETIVFLGYRRVRLEKIDGARAKMGRLFLGRTHGFTVRDGMDYWPEMVERPVEGNAEGFMGVPPTPGPDEEDRQLAEATAAAGEGGDGGEGEGEGDAEEVIVKELGFDVEIVG